jgi:hypothetical protein
MITKQTIKDLQQSAETINVSVYMPTHKHEPGVQQDPIRFKNLITEAENKLKEKHVDIDSIRSIKEKADELLSNPMFWRHNDEGLAVFITPDTIEYFKVPIKFAEQAYVDEFFLITPLIRMITLEGSFNVLALSQKNVRLLSCTRNTVEQIELIEAPHSMEKFREFDVYQRSVQQHSGQGKGTPIFHGHGGGDDDQKVISEYLKTIENEVTSIMRKENDPLILIGVENAVAHYEKVNHYSRLVDHPVTTNPDPLSDEQLLQKGWEQIQNHFLKDMYQDLENLNDLKGTDKISMDVHEIVENSYYGKTDTLFVQSDEQNWGVFEPEVRNTEESNKPSGKTDLLNLAALYTLEHGGDVYTICEQEAFSNQIAAIYRYS